MVLSLELVQGYLLLAMVEGSIQKTAFRASALGLYKFIHM